MRMPLTTTLQIRQRQPQHFTGAVCVSGTAAAGPAARLPALQPPNEAQWNTQTGRLTTEPLQHTGHLQHTALPCFPRDLDLASKAMRSSWNRSDLPYADVHVIRAREHVGAVAGEARRKHALHARRVVHLLRGTQHTLAVHVTSTSTSARQVPGSTAGAARCHGPATVPIVLQATSTCLD